MINEACHLAHLAHVNGALSDASLRQAFLNRIADEIEALGDTLLQTAHEESHLPLARLTGERGRTCGQLRRFAGLATDPAVWSSIVDEANPETGKPRLERIWVPLGPVAVFGASNFPLAFSVAGGDTASALGAGCPVVIKAHPAHPRTCDLVFGAMEAARVAVGLPEGVIGMVHGGVEVGQELVRNPHISAVGFTGSFHAGTSLWKTAHERSRPIPVFAEMGSVNPVVAMPGGQTSAWADAYAKSLTLGVGQFCTNPGLLIGWGEGFEAFVQEVAANLNAIDAGTMLTPGIQKSYEEGVLRRCQQVGSVTPFREGAAPYLARVDSRTFRQHGELSDELFGPSGLAIQCTDESDALALISELPGQLTGTVLHADGEKPDALLQALVGIAGRVILNGMPTGVEVSPAMHHGGPWPATTDSRFTSVGNAALERWRRPVCMQG